MYGHDEIDVRDARIICISLCDVIHSFIYPSTNSLAHLDLDLALDLGTYREK